MPTDACQFFYDCQGCGTRLKPKAGDCCVFCSYGNVPCPPIQAGGGCCAPAASAQQRDWLADPRVNAVAWWLPVGALIASLFAPLPFRIGIWTTALAWMGTACILNSRRCGRTHCRYTGPYYLAMIVPVFALGVVPVTLPPPAWAAIAVTILLGSGVIWWATERAWGRFFS
jgi:hypothetical protein